MKNTLIQIVVGAAVVVVGLVALNKFVPTFTLFPEKSEETGKEKMEDIEESIPAKIPQDDDLSGLEFDEEESTSPVIDLPQSTRPNTAYSADKRLKANSLGFVVPREIMINAKTKITINFYNEYCERNISGYQKEIKLYFALKKDDLAEAILFFAVKTSRKTYYFKPQGKDNLLKVPNNFANGSHKIEYGYILKDDVTEREIPFYSRSCRIMVED